MIIKNNSEVDKVIDFIGCNEFLAYDIESTGLNVRKDIIIGFGISNATESFYIAHKSFENGELVELVDATSCKLVLEALSQKSIMAWNSSFDIRFTYYYFGINLIDCLAYEGMLVKHTVDEEMPFQLKQVAKKLFGSDATKEQEEMKQSIKDNGGGQHDYYKADLDIMAKYCEQDCKLTFRIVEYYLDIIRKEGLYDFFMNKEVMPLYKNVTIPMEMSGVLLDVEALDRAHKDIVVDIENIVDKIQEEIKPLLNDFEKWYLWKEFSPAKVPSLFKQAMCEFAGLNIPISKTGKYSITKKNVDLLEDSMYKSYLVDAVPLPEDVVHEIQISMFKRSGEKYMFNLSSKDHLKRLFFDKLQEDPIMRTPTGAPQVDKLFLDEMSSKYEWVGDLMTLNKLNKLEGTYIGKWLREQEDGVFYPSWFQHRTTSGRYGGDLMQLSRRLSVGNPLVVKYTNMIRDFIIAGEGYKLVGADYSSLEVVVFADDAGDKELLDMIHNNEDFYSKVAMEVHGMSDKYSARKDSDNFFKIHEPELRQDAKVFGLGIRYGMKSYALSKTLNIPERDAGLIIDKYLESYPKLKNRMDSLVEFAKEYGYVKNKTGRVRHLSLLKSLSSSWGDDLLDGLKLWKKYHDAPSKYKQMKYLAKQYKNMINNALNFPIQSMAASIVNRSSIALAREFNRLGIDAKIVMNVHDELVVKCVEKDVKRVSKIMQFIMENTVKLSVPLSAIPEIGDKYGEIK